MSKPKKKTKRERKRSKQTEREREKDKQTDRVCESLEIKKEKCG